MFTNGKTTNVILGMFINVVKTVLIGAVGFNTRKRNQEKNNLGVCDLGGKFGSGLYVIWLTKLHCPTIIVTIEKDGDK